MKQIVHKTVCTMLFKNLKIMVDNLKKQKYKIYFIPANLFY